MRVPSTGTAIPIKRFLWRRRGAVVAPAWEPLVRGVPCFTCNRLVFVHPAYRDTSPLHPNPGGQWYCSVRCLDPDADAPELDDDDRDDDY